MRVLCIVRSPASAVTPEPGGDVRDVSNRNEALRAGAEVATPRALRQLEARPREQDSRLVAPQVPFVGEWRRTYE